MTVEARVSALYQEIRYRPPLFHVGFPCVIDAEVGNLKLRLNNDSQ